MSVAKHYTEWSKEDKEALATQRMNEMKKKNEELKRRYAEVEEDRKKAELQNSAVKLVIKSKSPPADHDGNFFDDSERTKESVYEDSHDGSRRYYNSRSKDFRNSRQGTAPRKPYEKDFDKGSNMSERKRDEHEKWKAERRKIDEERIARHTVVREWDEDKVKQEPELQALQHSKFYREPNWISKQDDRPQRRDFNQQGHYRGSDRPHFKNPRQNYESDNANWQDRPNRSFRRSETKGSFDKYSRASLSDDEDNRYSDRQWKTDSSDNNSSGFRRNQDGPSIQNFRSRGRGFSQGSRNDFGKPNSASLSNQNNSFSRNVSTCDPNPVHTSRVHNSADNYFDRRNDGQGTNFKERFRGSDAHNHTKSRVARQSSGPWSSDEGTDPTTSTAVTAQKSDNSRTKQSSGNWSDDDNTCHKTNDRFHSIKHGGSFSKPKQSFGDTWSDDNTSSNVNSALLTPKPQQSSSTWSDDDSSSNTKAGAKTSAHRNDNSFPKTRKKTTGDTWSDDDNNCVNIKSNSQSSQKHNSASWTKQSSSTWSDDDGTNVKQHSKSPSSTDSKDRISSGGAWSGIDDESSTGKSRNDDAWLDISDKNENSSSWGGNSRKWPGKQPPVNFPAGRGRKWSFEPSRQYSSEAKSSSYNDHDERRSENRAITLSTNDNLTVTIHGGSNDLTGKKPFSQWGARNSESFCKYTEKTQQGLSRSYSDPNKNQVKRDEPYHMRRHDDNRGFQQNSRDFRSRGSSLKRGSFGSTGFQKSNFENSPQQKFYDSSRSGARGGFQHNNSFSRGARRSGEARRYPESWETHNRSSRSQKSEKPDEGWDDIGKENSAVNVHSEDIWGDTECSENANLSPEWTDGNNGKSQCLKSEQKTDDGWETENCDERSFQLNSSDENRKSEEYTDYQVKEKNQMDNDKNKEGILQNNHSVSRSENMSADTKRNIPEAEQSPLHDESRDDSSWVTTSSGEFEEELGGGYIDDDESLQIAGVRYDYGDDTSSPEPVQNFVCSMTQYLNLAKAAEIYTANDEIETEEVHGTEELKNLDNTLCSTPKVENVERIDMQCSEQNELSNCREESPACESNGVIEDCLTSNVVLSTTGDEQKFLSESHIEKSDDKQLSVADHCINVEYTTVDDGNQKAMSEMEVSPEQPVVSSADHNPITTGESCQVLYRQETYLSESACDKNGAQISIVHHSKNSDQSLCSETVYSSDVANNLSDFTSPGNLPKNCVSVDTPKLTEPILNETASSVNSECSNRSEELSELPNSTVHNVDKETTSVCITCSDSASCDDHDRLAVLSHEENSLSKMTCNKQEDKTESEVGNHVISANELGDETEVQDETALSTTQINITNSTAHSKIPIPSEEDLSFKESVPPKDCLTTDPTGKDV